MKIQNLIDAIKNERLRITDHADEEAFSDNLLLEEIFSSVISGEIIESYPKDRPFPSCLVFEKILKGNQFIVFGLTMKKIVGRY